MQAEKDRLIGTVPLANDEAFPSAWSSSVLQYLPLIHQTVSQNPQHIPRLQDLCEFVDPGLSSSAQSGRATLARQLQDVKGTAMLDLNRKSNEGHLTQTHYIL